MREKFMFFQNFKETADKLPDDLRLKFYDAMTDYVFNGVEPEDSLINALITAIKPSLDKTDERGGAREGSGRKSNEIKNNQNNSKEIKTNQNNQSFQETETETETRNGSIEKENIEKEKVAKAPIRFHKPTLDEVREYIKQKGYSFSAEQFYAYYESNGWKVGRNPMKDWKMACVTWQAKEKQPQQIGIDEEANMSKEERFQLFLKRCGVSEVGGAV